jgi:hypothetical protein
VDAAAFAANPELPDEPKPQRRYNAARQAALSAAGQSEDSGKLDRGERTRLRQQPLGWLRDDLILRAKQSEGGQPADRAAVQRARRYGQQDPDRAGLCDKELLAKLPLDEQEAFARLWADVAAALKKAEGKPNQPRLTPWVSVVITPCDQ